MTHTISLSANRATLAYDASTQAVVLGGIREYGVGVAAEAEFPLASAGEVGQIAMTFDPAGNVAGLRCRSNGATCDLEILVDSDADRALEDESGILVQTVTGGGNPSLQAADLATDPAGRWVAGYVRRTFGPEAVVAHDRNGDGDFGDTNEIVVVASGLGGADAIPADLAVDAAGRVAYVYERPSSGSAIFVAYDRSGDGDYTDTVDGNPEFSTLASGTLVNCLATTFDAAGHLAIVYGNASGRRWRATPTATATSPTRARPLRSRPVRRQLLRCRVPRGTAVRVLHYRAGVGTLGMHLLLDKNDDGDFRRCGRRPDAPAHAEQRHGSGAGAERGDRAIIATPSSIVRAATN